MGQAAMQCQNRAVTAAWPVPMRGQRVGVGGKGRQGARGVEHSELSSEVQFEIVQPVLTPKFLLAYHKKRHAENPT